jgi:calcineurin-like phosphoesterase family protein
LNFLTALALAVAAAAPGQQQVKVIAVGDSAADTPPARRVAAFVRAEHPRLVLYLGDVYETGTAAEFRNNYDPQYGSLARRTLPTPGNHEWPNAQSGYLPYWRAALGRELPPYYERRLYGWQFLSLNSELTGADRVRQLRWLRAHIRGPRDCRIAFWHRPRFSAGFHGDEADLDGLWRAVRGRARLVLNGHEHDFERLRPRDGTTELIAGAGGRSRYPVNPLYRNLVFGTARYDGVLRIWLSRHRADLAFVTDAGRVLDRSSVDCR